jgi:Xaa-Pro aminopeptidase
VTSRLDRAQALAQREGVDALLVTPGADLRYLTGYAAKPLERLTCLVVRASGDPVLVVPRLEKQAALDSGTTVELATWDESDDPFALVASIVGESAGTVALDDQMWASRVFSLGAALPGTDQVLAGPLLTELRMRKDAAEVAALRAAGEAIDRVHARMGEFLRVGRTEREVGADIARAILQEGHETVDFVIVGSGPNGASPHHEVSDRVIGAGEPVVVDLGGTTPEGYCSDSTRNYVAGGEPPADYLAKYEVLLAAQTAQREHARAGVTAASVDAVGRDLMTEAGIGELFLHRTGHGIGQETHEEPYIIEGNDLALEPGMAFSIEPGFYVEGSYGARIEDIAVVAEDGSLEVLNGRPRELVRLP